MSRMFDNYTTSDWVCNTDSSPVSLFNFEEYEGIKFLHDKKGNFYGIEAKYLKPFTLYFGLRDALDQNIDEYVQNGAIQVQFCSTGPNSKIIFEKI